MPPVLPKKTQPTANSPAGTKVSTEATPSRESHEVRHCEKARHARSGWPRWKVEEISPPTARPKDTANATTPNQELEGSRPRGPRIPSRNSSPNPAPEAEVKKITENAGFIWPRPPGPTPRSASSPSSREHPVHPTEQPLRLVARGLQFGHGRRGRIATSPRAGREVLVDRLVAHLRHQVVAAALLDHSRDIRIGVAEIAEVPGIGGAGGDAGGLPIDLLEV